MDESGSCTGLKLQDMLSILRSAEWVIDLETLQQMHLTVADYI
jgi:hypothetical protein